MSTFKTTLAAVLASLIITPAFAQMDHSAHGGMGGSASGYDLPEICLENADGDQGGSMGMDMPMDDAMSAGHTEMMANMGTMHEQMMAGMTASDFDVAFVCGMIPHHQGAIDMANAAIEHAEDEWVRSLAQEIVDAQEVEIAEMMAWLEER